MTPHRNLLTEEILINLPLVVFAIVSKSIYKSLEKLCELLSVSSLNQSLMLVYIPLQTGKRGSCLTFFLPFFQTFEELFSGVWLRNFSFSAPPLELYSSVTADRWTMGSLVPVVRGKELDCSPPLLLSDCQSSSAVIYSGSAAKNKQNRDKLMLGEERRLIPDCASAKNTPPPHL